MNRHFENITREPQFAGTFYSAGKVELETEINSYFEKAEKPYPTNKHLQAIISPHAGYVFSGSVAASAYNQIQEPALYKRVFVLASSHRYNFGGASVFLGSSYKTPLGKIKTDQQVATELTQNSACFFEKNDVHSDEHSLEVQLPFLQQKMGTDFLLIPIILGTNKPETCQQIALQLKPWFTPENLFVISTDLSHYPTYNEARIVDQKTLEAICLNQPEKLLETLDNNRKLGIEQLATSLCGWTSVLTLLHLTHGQNVDIVKVDYKNSGDAEMFANKSRVVGYGAIAVYHK